MSSSSRVGRLEEARVIVVEDNLDLAENVTEILEDEGARVRVAGTAAEGARLAETAFDVALVDVRLPDSTGLDLLARMKVSGDGLGEILLVTGNATVEDAIRAVEGGAYAYILKPFHGDDLIGHVERAHRQVRSSRMERRLAGELRLRERKLRTLVDTVQALLLVLDEEGRVVQANPAVAALTGIPAEELVGMDWMTSFVPAEYEEEARRVFDRLLGGESPVTLEHPILARRGDQVVERMVSWRSSVLIEEGRLMIYASGLDVTEVRDYERRAELQGRLAALGTLSAGLAHEIRNPLNSARLQLQVLERRAGRLEGGASLLEPIKLVHGEIGRLSRLLQEFLEFARPQALAVRDVDVVELAHRVVALEQPSAEEQGVRLELTAPEPASVRGDTEKIQQALLNLIRNAVEATPAGGRVDVEVDRDDDGVQISVRDTGAGIPPEIIDRMFEPFFTTKSGGTGLGMSICHSLITRHGGDITVRSPPGKGAEFIVWLPARPPEAGRADIPAPLSSVGPTNSVSDG